jgi:hypothetical protein
MDHCRVCGIEHASGACGECVGEVRENLAEILEMCASIPGEAETKGVESDAMVLLGPVADPEAWGHVTASMAAGRLPADWRLLGEDWLETATDANHPLLVLGDWEMVYRDAFDHTPQERAEIHTAAAYLGQHLTEAASEPWVAFEAMAKAIRKSRTYVERVLHDGEQVDLGVRCMKCDHRLRRVWGVAGAEDGWKCDTCQQWSNDKQYQLALKRDYIKRAEWLTDVDMAVRVPGVTASTVRSWAATKGDRPVLIRKKLHTQRTVYSVEDVEWIYACTQDTTDAA